MSPELITLAEKLGSSASSALMLFLATYYLARTLKGQYDDRIKTLESRSDSCEGDRKELSRRIHDIQQERIGILERLLEEEKE